MTKQERHVLYKDLLKQYLTDVKNGSDLGLCVSLDRLNNDELIEIEDLPELMSFQPKSFFDTWGRVTNRPLYWFPIYDTQFRINILEQCIKLTTP